MERAGIEQYRRNNTVMPEYVYDISSDVTFYVLGINTTLNKNIIIEYEYS